MEIVTEFFFKVRFRLNLCLGNWMIKLDKWADCSHFNADSRCGLWSGLQQLWTQPRQWSWVPRDCWSLRTMPRPTLQAPTSHSEKESQVGLLWAYPVFADLMLSHIRICGIKLPAVCLSSPEADTAAAGAGLSHQHQRHSLLESQPWRYHRLLPGLLHGGSTGR